MIWTDIPEIAPRHAAMLEAHGVTPEWAKRAGVFTATEAPAGWNGQHRDKFPGLIYTWRFNGQTELQLATDDRITWADDKYVFRTEPDRVFLNELIPIAETTRVALIVEGSKQQLVAAANVGADIAVFGVSGCWNWKTMDLSCFAGVGVVVIFDGDIRTKRLVYDGAAQLQDVLDLVGATSVKFALLPTSGGDGLDDLLARYPADKRPGMLGRLIEKAEPRLPRRPAKDAGKPKPAFFDDDHGLLVETLVKTAFDRCPSLLPLERKTIATYHDGVYRIDGTAFVAIITELLGEDFRSTYLTSATDVGVGMLWREGKMLPDHLDRPLLNCRNGMLDLATGLLLPPSPDYGSMTQVPIEWDPDATCPTYESWLRSVCREDQIEDLEEITSLMLDPSTAPQKAIFLYGPSRSGKGTYLRLMEATAGKANRSSVDLHQLVSNRFMAATVYGKMLNSSGDLSAAHIEDISVFKRMTGEDPITADRKYGGTFEFTNRALFAFAANEILSVGENSRAFKERIKPFRFDRSFAGHEDASIEQQMMQELPGILVRWVRAYQRLAKRGCPLPSAADVAREFETRSDRVMQWLDEAMIITPAGPGDTLPEDKCRTTHELHSAFNRWADQDNSHRMKMSTVMDRLRTIPGVTDEVWKPNRARAWNIAPKPRPEPEQSAQFAQFRRTSAIRETNSEEGLSETHRRGSFKTAQSAQTARLALDLETTGLDLWSPGPEFVRIAGIRRDGGEVEVITDIGCVVELIERSVMVIGHNLLGFDFLALARYHGLDIHDLAARGAIRDTKIMAALADPPEARMVAGQIEKRYSLDNLGTELLGEGKHGDGKALAKKFGGWGEIPLDDPTFLEYINGDVLVTDRLVDVLPWTPYALREHQVAAIAAQISLNGFRVDVPELIQRRDHVRKIRARRVKELQDRYGLPTHTKDGRREAKSPQTMDEGRKAIRKAFEDRGAEFMPKAPTGAPATSMLAMEKMVKRYGHLDGVTELAETVKELAGQRVIYETVSDCLVDDRVHPMISLRQAAGRWSVTKPGLTVMGKNGERVHERAVFLPEPGEVLLSFDLSQVDARAVAALSGDTEYARLFAPGRDSHTEVALRVFGDPGMRQQAKIIGHGYNYGLSVNGMVRNGVERELAEQFDREMKASFPRLQEWRTEVRSIAESGDLLDNGFGRLMRAQPERAWTQAPALMGQGCARDIMMTGLLRLPPSVLLMLRAQVHDEIILSVPVDAVEDVRRVVVEALSFEWHEVPIVAEASKPGQTWAECYRK
jgi:P4 family phage/plasmid primase-like protien